MKKNDLLCFDKNITQQLKPYFTRGIVDVILFCVISLMLISPALYSQNESNRILTFRLVDSNATPIEVVNKKVYTRGQSLEAEFQNFNVTRLERAFPLADSFDHPLAESLSRVYYVEVDGDVDSLRDVLINNANGKLDRIETFIDDMLLVSSLNDPPQCFPDDPLESQWNSDRHDMLCLREAWCIT
jgi:hypothetical protein